MHTFQLPKNLSIDLTISPNFPIRPRIVQSMIIRNEKDNFLELVLKHIMGFTDGIVLIDDASTDGSLEMAKDILNGFPHHILALSEPLYGISESLIRRLQWEQTIKYKPRWILQLDADEIFEDGFEKELDILLDNRDLHIVGFRKYDMWDENHYRDDEHWSAHKRLWPHLIRYKPKLSNDFNLMKVHCGRMPSSYIQQEIYPSSIRIQHFGNSNPLIRRRKFNWYFEIDPKGECGSIAQVNSLLDESPNLIRWEEE